MEIFCSERGEGEIEAERRAEGRRVSAITNKMGAENQRSEINMVIKKKIVFTPLKTRLLLSSLNTPICFISFLSFPFVVVIQSF